MLDVWLRRLMRRGIREGWRRGVNGGSPAWTIIGAAGLLGWLAIRVLAREPEVVFSERLRPGEAFRIYNEPQL